MRPPRAGTPAREPRTRRRASRAGAASLGRAPVSRRSSRDRGARPRCPPPIGFVAEDGTPERDIDVVGLAEIVSAPPGRRSVGDDALGPSDGRHGAASSRWSPSTRKTPRVSRTVTWSPATVSSAPEPSRPGTSAIASASSAASRASRRERAPSRRRAVPPNPRHPPREEVFPALFAHVDLLAGQARCSRRHRRRASAILGLGSVRPVARSVARHRHQEQHEASSTSAGIKNPTIQEALVDLLGSRSPTRARSASPPRSTGTPWLAPAQSPGASSVGTKSCRWSPSDGSPWECWSSPRCRASTRSAGSPWSGRPTPCWWRAATPSTCATGCGNPVSRTYPSLRDTVWVGLSAGSMVMAQDRRGLRPVETAVR